jgi:hypothetical protein
MATDTRRVAACKRRFREFYPKGFHDEDYVVMERLYKWDAHKAWNEARATAGTSEDLARAAVRIESRTNLLFSFEKMAIRDAVATTAGATTFANGLDEWLYGRGGERQRFEQWCEVVAQLPRRQTRVLTWPVATVFGFIARPKVHLFLKPNVTRRAAEALASTSTTGRARSGTRTPACSSSPARSAPSSRTGVRAT